MSGPLAVLGAVAVGAAFGYGAQRGAFCMSSGFRGALRGDGTKLRALALAVGVQLAVLPLVFAAGLAKPVILPAPLLAALAGGLLFGLSMRWAGGCAAGILYKLGAGDLGALLAVLGLALGATAAATGPLTAVRVRLQGVLPDVGSWAPDPAVSVTAGLAVLAVLTQYPPRLVGAWDWRRTGLWIGVVATLAWPVAALGGRSFGLAVVPGATGLVSAVSGASFPAWDLALVLGLVLGGAWGARRGGAIQLSAPGPAALVRRFMGGFGLGVGAQVATGCTVGHGLTGLALLAPGSALVTASIFAGTALGTIADRRWAPSPVVARAARS